jgi:NADPH:quinone reductase-like Zn-dependent oxidoreductase
MHPNTSTAFQGLVVYGEMKPNDDVLVHAGASGMFFLHPGFLICLF